MDEIQKAPGDFPREHTQGSVSGVQPKILVVKEDDRFISEVDEEEIYRRWLVCEDLAQQLVVKTVKRMREGRVADLTEYAAKLQQWLEVQEWEGWRVTRSEAQWMRDRIKALVEADKESH